jgi:hypothetical protein
MLAHNYWVSDVCAFSDLETEKVRMQPVAGFTHLGLFYPVPAGFSFDSRLHGNDIIVKICGHLRHRWMKPVT